MPFRPRPTLANAISAITILANAISANSYFGQISFIFNPLAAGTDL